MKRSALYYASHPEAAAKKRKYQAQREKSPEQVRYRVERKRERRRRGIYGKGGPDMSHTESGKMVPEDPSTNRARNGHGGKPRFKADSGCSPDRLTVGEIRADKKCGESAIPDNRKCTKNTKNTRNAVITAGAILGSAAALGLALRSKKAPAATISTAIVPRPGITPRMVRRNPPPTPTPKSTTAPRALPGTPPPYGLLSPAPPRLSKTARMRANTAAAEKVAEQRIAQTAREELRRIGQIGNTMAATGEAAGMRVKTTVREVKLRLEAARRKFEPGYRSVPVAPKALKPGEARALPQSSLRDRIPEGVEIPPWTPKDEVEFKLAQKRGKKWDEFEKNKDVPRCDALQACSRRVGNPSFFAQYVVGMDGKTGFKSPAPRHRLNLAKDPGRRSGLSKNFTAVSPRIAKVFDNEAVMHALATKKGVDAPKLLAYNEKTKVLKMEHLADYISVKSSGEALDYFLDPQLTGKYLNTLEKLHRAGIAHTDLHAGNIMMHRTTRNIKIIDFGTAMDARWGVDEVNKYVGTRVANAFRPFSGRDYLYIDIRGATNAVTMSTISQAEMSVILRKTIGMNVPSKGHWLEGVTSDIMDRKIAEYYAELRKALLNHTKNGTVLASSTGVFGRSGALTGP